MGLSATTQENLELGCLLGICSVNILVFPFERQGLHKALQLCRQHHGVFVTPFTVFYGGSEMTVAFAESFHC